MRSTEARNVVDWPGVSIFVVRPLQLFASELLFFEHSLKSCESAPPFVTLKITMPRFTDFLESVKLSSLGLPAVTLTVVMSVEDLGAA